MTQFFIALQLRGRRQPERSVPSRELAINYCRQQAVIAKEVNNETRPTGRKTRRDKERAGRPRERRGKLIVPRSASFGNRKRAKRHRPGNGIGPSEKLHCCTMKRRNTVTTTTTTTTTITTALPPKLQLSATAPTCA